MAIQWQQERQQTKQNLYEGISKQSQGHLLFCLAFQNYGALMPAVLASLVRPIVPAVPAVPLRTPEQASPQSLRPSRQTAPRAAAARAARTPRAPVTRGPGIGVKARPVTEDTGNVRFRSAGPQGIGSSAKQAILAKQQPNAGTCSDRRGSASGGKSVLAAHSDTHASPAHPCPARSKLQQHALHNAHSRLQRDQPMAAAEAMGQSGQAGRA